MSERKSGSPLLTVFLTVFIDLLGVTIIIPILAPLLLKETVILGPEYSDTSRNVIYGLLLGSLSILQFFSAPLLGTMSDKYGRRKVLNYSLLVTLTGYIVFTIAVMQYSLIGLFLGRSIVGLASGNLAVINSAIADISKPEDRAKNFGVVGMAFGIGFVIGPFLGGILSNSDIVSWFNYATPFMLSALLVVINLLLVYFAFPETLLKPNPNASISPLNGFKNIGKAFRNAEMRNIFFSVFLFYLGFSFFTQFFQPFLIEKFDFGTSEIGNLFAFVGVVVALTQGGLVRIVSRRFSSAPIIRITLLGLVAAFLVLLLPDSVGGLYAVVPGVAIFQGLTAPNLSAIISNSASEDVQGEVLGIQQSMQSLANIIPPLVGGLAVSLLISLPILW
ncbi:MAG: MFS transporter [Bacteroidota bacterium]